MAITREAQELYNRMLDDNFCQANEVGNRPCDEGVQCDNCSQEWFIQEYRKELKVLHTQEG